MKYLNTKTQAVIETACVVSGGNWVEVKNQPTNNTQSKAPAQNKATEKKTLAKKTTAKKATTKKATTKKTTTRVVTKKNNTSKSGD